jgi:phosphoserine phosphatase
MDTEPQFPLRLVCFDVDGTLVDGLAFIWELLHDHYGTSEQARKWAYNAYFAGEITYEEWCDHDLGLLRAKGASRSGMDEAMQSMSLMPGARETLQALVDAGKKLAVVSGSLDLALGHVLPEYKDWFDDVFINRFLFDDQGILTGIVPTPFDIDHKATAVRRLAERERIPIGSIGFVGDNFNDVEAARAAGFAVAFNCRSEELAAVVDVVVPGKDLRDVLPHLLRRE